MVLLAGVAAPAAVLSFSLGTQLVDHGRERTVGGACMAFMLRTVPWRVRVPVPVEPAPVLVAVAVPAPAVSGGRPGAGGWHTSWVDSVHDFWDATARSLIS